MTGFNIVEGQSLDSSVKNKNIVQLEVISQETLPVVADQSYGKNNQELDANIALRNLSNTTSNTAYGASWSGATTTAPSQNAVYNKIESMTTTINDKVTMSDLFLLMGA